MNFGASGIFHLKAPILFSWVFFRGFLEGGFGGKGVLDSFITSFISFTLLLQSREIIARHLNVSITAVWRG